MDFFQEHRQKSINNTLAVIKLASLIFGGIIFFNEMSDKINITYNKDESYYGLIKIIVISVMLLLIYWLWSFSTVKIHKLKNNKITQVSEYFIFISIYSILMFSTDGYRSNLKFLFLFIIIMAAIESGKNYGIAVAFVSSVIVLTVDLVYLPKGINMYFENDLILVGIFILIAWTLGHYIKIEQEYMLVKNQQLETMNKEMKENKEQRQYMEELLLKDDACYNLLIENSSDAILVHRNGKIIFGNESASKLLSTENVDRLIHTKIFDYVPKEDSEILEGKLKHIYNERIAILVFEHKITKNNEDMVVVQNTSTFFLYEGKPAILSILHDITPEKQVEKLQKDMKENINLLNESREFNRLITEFFSNISHELKTPLNVIFSAVQLLNVYNVEPNECFDLKQKKYLKIMKQNCYRLMRLINNILDMTKLDSGFIKLNHSNYNIIAVVEDIVLSVASYAESKGITMIFDTDVEEKVMAFDPDKVERIILNLLSNAVKFTNDGGEIFVNLFDKEDSIIISIRDTGIGIPQDKSAIIFERFIQVDKTLRRDHEGTGIGLSLVKSFVEMHKGKIELKSEVNNGSEFIITLPANVLEQEVIKENNIYDNNIERINIEFSDIYS